MLSNVLFMLLGAGLLALGVIAAAIADRIRGLRAARETAPRERASRAQSAPAVISVVETADLRSTPVTKTVRAVRAEPKINTEGGDDVIAALVAAGYKKSIASDATWACSIIERATIENWTRSALQRCIRGSAS